MGITHKYDDIIDLPHHVSAKRAKMSLVDRGAQFSPFAALTGFDAAIQETGRLTDARVELTESAKAALNEKIRHLADTANRQPRVTVTYFLPDQRKSGGEYITVTGQVKKVDPYIGAVILTDGRRIPFADITQID